MIKKLFVVALLCLTGLLFFWYVNVPAPTTETTPANYPTNVNKPSPIFTGNGNGSSSPVATSSLSSSVRGGRFTAFPESALVGIAERWEKIDDGGKYYSKITPEYTLAYTKDYDQIQLAVTAEPAGRIRIQAEEEIAAVTKIPRAELCGYNIYVVQRTWRTGENYEIVGLDSCPGSVELWMD